MRFKSSGDKTTTTLLSLIKVKKKLNSTCVGGFSRIFGIGTVDGSEIPFPTTVWIYKALEK